MSSSMPQSARLLSSSITKLVVANRLKLWYNAFMMREVKWTDS